MGLTYHIPLKAMLILYQAADPDLSSSQNAFNPVKYTISTCSFPGDRLELQQLGTYSVYLNLLVFFLSLGRQFNLYNLNYIMQKLYH
jgi:hypothetical protein